MKTPLLFALVSLVFCAGCERGVFSVPTDRGGTLISDSGGSATLYIVEKDGYKFAVLVGTSKCALVQLK